MLSVARVRLCVVLVYTEADVSVKGVSMRLAQLFVTWFCIPWCILSGVPLAGTLRYVTNQQEKVVILCISLSIQCHKQCYIIFQVSWQPEPSILSMLPPSASVSKIVFETCAALWKVLQPDTTPVPNKAMGENCSAISAFPHCAGSVRMGRTWLCKHRLTQDLFIFITKRHTVLFC